MQPLCIDCRNAFVPETQYHMKKHLLHTLILLLMLLSAPLAKATHIVGGEIYYDSLGNNQYKITFEIYRDCSSFTDYDNPLEYTIFYGDGTLWSEFTVPIFMRDSLQIVYDDPCVIPPDDICIEKAIYIDTVTLPFDVLGYYISYQRCCWASNMENIVDPSNNGITLTNYIPGSNLVNVHNNSARFINYPPLVLCANNSLNFDHSAIDPDGDSLVYSLMAPYLGGNTANVTPNPETAPPYTDVSWQPGFSATQPFGLGSTTTINAATGMILFTPDMIGNFVAGVAVSEYRNGILINTKIRTFGYRVVECVQTIPIEVVATDLSGVVITSDASILEDCGDINLAIARTDTSEVLGIKIIIEGTSTNGVDYEFIPDTMNIETGVFADTIKIVSLLDTLTEGDETLIVRVIIRNLCGSQEYDTTSYSIVIRDYIAMQITQSDSINVCADFGEGTMLWCKVTHGDLPYVYTWNPGPLPNNDTVYITANMLNPNLNQFYVLVGDNCGKGIYSEIIDVYNQCPLIVPNVVTANGDGINDALIITNLEDFNRVSLKIFNRYGNVIYENDAYLNDWKGTDSSGKSLSDGVYFYLVTPVSEKFTYDDQEETKYTAHGFFHLYTH